MWYALLYAPPLPIIFQNRDSFNKNRHALTIPFVFGKLAHDVDFQV